MRLEQHDAPLLPWLFPPCPVPGTSIFDDGLGLGAPLDERASRAWIGQYLVQPMAPGQLPEEGVACCPRVDLGQRQLRIPVPPHGLTGPPEFAKLLAQAGQRLWPLRVGDLFPAMSCRAYKAHRHCPHDMATADVVFAGFPRPLTQQAQRLFGHRALHAEDAAIVQLAWLIDASGIHAPGCRQGTAIDQMGPGPVVPRHAGRFQRYDNPDTPLTHGGQELPQAWALLEPWATTAYGVIDDDAVPKAQGASPVRQGIWAPLACMVGTDLMRAGLADLEGSGTGPRCRTKLLTHG